MGNGDSRGLGGGEVVGRLADLEAAPMPMAPISGRVDFDSEVVRRVADLDVLRHAAECVLAGDSRLRARRRKKKPGIWVSFGGVGVLVCLVVCIVAWLLRCSIVVTVGVRACVRACM